MTRKAITNFQRQEGLPETGLPDEATVAKIEEDLAALDAQPYKKKGGPPLPPAGNPGDPLIP